MVVFVMVEVRCDGDGKEEDWEKVEILLVSSDECGQKQIGCDIN